MHPPAHPAVTLLDRAAGDLAEHDAMTAHLSRLHADLDDLRDQRERLRRQRLEAGVAAERSAGLRGRLRALAGRRPRPDALDDSAPDLLARLDQRLAEVTARCERLHDELAEVGSRARSREDLEQAYDLALAAVVTAGETSGDLDPDAAARAGALLVERRREQHRRSAVSAGHTARLSLEAVEAALSQAWGHAAGDTRTPVNLDRDKREALATGLARLGAATQDVARLSDRLGQLGLAAIAPPEVDGADDIREHWLVGGPREMWSDLRFLRRLESSLWSVRACLGRVRAALTTLEERVERS